MSKKTEKEDIELTESVLEDTEDIQSALIVEVEKDVRILVYQKPRPKEYLLQSQITTIAQKDGKVHKKDDVYQTWINVASLGNMRDCIRYTAEFLVHGHLKSKRIVALGEYIKEQKKVNSDLEKILNGTGL